MTHNHIKQHSSTTAPSASQHKQPQPAQLSPDTPQPAQPQNWVLQQPETVSRLQRTVGNQAMQQMIQRNFISQTEEKFKTPAQVIKDKTGLAFNKMGLPNNGNTGGDEVRARKVVAEIDKDTLRPGKREGKVPPVITGMARAEQKILNGSVLDKYFDAGHLIADELIGNAEDSFDAFNLAPQNSVFNEESYRVFENKVKRWAEAGNTIKLTAELNYGSDTYNVSIQDLINNKVITQELLDKQNTRKSKPKINLGDQLTIYRRVPQTWKLKSSIADYKKPNTTTPPSEKRQNYGLLSHGGRALYSDPLPNRDITLGQGHFFNIPDSVKTTVTPVSTSKSKIKQNVNPITKKKRNISGKQWQPTGQVSREELVSLIKGAYPKLKEEEITALFNSTDLSNLNSITDEVLGMQLKDAVDMYNNGAGASLPTTNDTESMLQYYTECSQWFEGKLTKEAFKNKRSTILSNLKAEDDPAKKLIEIVNYLDVYKREAKLHQGNSLVMMELIKLHETASKDNKNRLQNTEGQLLDTQNELIEIKKRKRRLSDELKTERKEAERSKKRRDELKKERNDVSEENVELYKQIEETKREKELMRQELEQMNREKELMRQELEKQKLLNQTMSNPFDYTMSQGDMSQSFGFPMMGGFQHNSFPNFPTMNTTQTYPSQMMTMGGMGNFSNMGGDSYDMGNQNDIQMNTPQQYPPQMMSMGGMGSSSNMGGDSYDMGYQNNIQMNTPQQYPPQMMNQGGMGQVSNYGFPNFTGINVPPSHPPHWGGTDNSSGYDFPNFTMMQMPTTSQQPPMLNRGGMGNYSQYGGNTTTTQPQSWDWDNTDSDYQFQNDDGDNFFDS